MSSQQDQQAYDVRFEWGRSGADAVLAGARFAVVVDVLRFTTTVSVAIDAGAEVFPYQWGDESAAAFARKHKAGLAGDLVTLSPASITAAPGLTRLVLPSPNGSALVSYLAGAGATVVAACLRNRSAVARWLAGQPGGVIAVLAAGERWPDGSLRAAEEDLLGAGAVIAALAGLGVTGLSPEARMAAGAFRAAERDLGGQLLACASGMELAGKGLGADVTIAADLDASDSVPVLASGRFSGASRPAG